MIYKILTRSTPSFQSLITYISKESKNTEPEIFTHNLRSDGLDIEGLTKEYLVNESFRAFHRSDQKYLNHEILSFHDEDTSKITPELLQDIAQKYIALRGNEGVYYGAVHRDQNHAHIHFAVSGLKYRTGRSHHIPKDKLQELKIELQAYQKEKYPELSKSLPKHGRGKEYLTDRQWYANQKEKRNIQKDDMRDTILSSFEQAKTQNGFLELLRDSGFHHYERKGIAQGIISPDGMKFRFTRLGITPEQFKGLPVDQTEELKALSEIESLRQQHTVSKNSKEEIER
ncbi:MAG: relaxase/mobilization nuclease domain-containing protein [Bacteroidota bacterium]|nr:relaxase/mobilization nuclease domain-containing protein [Bacteroidota bacterium]